MGQPGSARKYRARGRLRAESRGVVGPLLTWMRVGRDALRQVMDIGESQVLRTHLDAAAGSKEGVSADAVKELPTNWDAPAPLDPGSRRPIGSERGIGGVATSSGGIDPSRGDDVHRIAAAVLTARDQRASPTPTLAGRSLSHQAYSRSTSPLLPFLFQSAKSSTFSSSPSTPSTRKRPRSSSFELSECAPLLPAT